MVGLAMRCFHYRNEGITGQIVRIDEVSYVVGARTISLLSYMPAIDPTVTENNGVLLIRSLRF
jgi:hypothetical protein